MVLGRGGIAPPRLHQADHELVHVLRIAQLIRPQRLEGPRRNELVPGLLAVHRQVDIARQQLRHQAQVRQPLDVGMAAQGIHAAAGYSDIAEQQLHHRSLADHLRAD